jgi:4-amino-4-deoxy-L-arabinose transferase-like glycosyltransferase
MTSSRPARLALLLLLVLATFVANAGALEANIMEARNLTTAREMLASGDWLSPTMNGEPRLEKPPLPTWAAAVAMKAFGEERLGLLRLPAALAAILLVFFLHRLTRELTDDDAAPFLAAATAATSMYVVLMARDVSWDVFCHAFMLGAVWQLHRGLAPDGRSRGPFLLAGLLMGLSFLSKGPVAFYALLLPWLVARFASSGRAPFVTHRRGLLAAALVALAIAVAWPLHAYLRHPELAAQVARQESSAWMDRSVRPFFHYWSFPVQSGVWALLSTAALVLPQARRRVEALASHRLLSTWVWTGVLLLSLVPEKKERYLLPVLLPLAILTAVYVRGVVRADREGAATRAETFLVRLHGGLMALAAIALPLVVWWMARRNGAALGRLEPIASAAVFSMVAAWLARAAWRAEPAAVWSGTVALVAAAGVLAAGTLPKVLTSNRSRRPYEELRHRPELAGVPFFRSGDVHGKFIQVVWAAGREIAPWDPRTQPSPPVDPPLALMSSEPAAEVLGREICERYEVVELGVFDANQWGPARAALRNHVTLVRPRSP